MNIAHHYTFLSFRISNNMEKLINIIQSKLYISNRKKAMDVIRGIGKENGGRLTGMKLKPLNFLFRKFM